MLRHMFCSLPMFSHVLMSPLLLSPEPGITFIVVNLLFNVLDNST